MTKGPTAPSIQSANPYRVKAEGRTEGLSDYSCTSKDDVKSRKFNVRGNGTVIGKWRKG